jgi:hypothetical protein
MKHARIVDSTVFEVFVPPTGFAVSDCFTAEIATQFQPCADEVQGGWLVQEDGSLVAPPEPVEPPTIEETETPTN